MSKRSNQHDSSKRDRKRAERKARRDRRDLRRAGLPPDAPLAAASFTAARAGQFVATLERHGVAYSVLPGGMITCNFTGLSPEAYDAFCADWEHQYQAAGDG